MSSFDITLFIVLGLGVLTFVYAVIRVTWRLRHGDVESAGSDGKTFVRDKRDG